MQKVMKNTITLYGLTALAPVIVCAALFLAGCSNEPDPEPAPEPVTGIFSDIVKMEDWLNTLPRNDTYTPYTVKLIVDNIDFKALKTLLVRSGRYINLDLSGSTITIIEDDAFDQCGDVLTGVIIPVSVDVIGKNAFANCYNLTSVTMPGVKEIGDYAFGECIRLAGVTIPASVTKIGNEAFYRCESVTRIDIPDGVEEIGDYVFWECTGLIGVTIPASVTRIGGGAFYGCRSLTGITIPDSVASIGDSTFSWCKALKSVEIPDSVTAIGNGAFSGCESLTLITLPESVTSIGNGAFYGCNWLASVTIKGKVTSIGKQAFQDCENLSSIEIPNSVTGIGEGAFLNCRKLEKIDIKDVGTDTPVYHSESGVLYDIINKTLIQYPARKPDKEHIIYGVTSIGDNAFYGSTILENITISAGVTNIGDRAFYGCTSLTSVKFESTIPSSGFTNAFYGLGDLQSILGAEASGTYTRSSSGNTWTKQ